MHRPVASLRARSVLPAGAASRAAAPMAARGTARTMTTDTPHDRTRFDRALLEAAALPGAWAGTNCWTVVDANFEAGERWLALSDLWLADPQRPARLRCVGLLPNAAALSRLTSVDAARGPRRIARWPPAIDGVHRIALADSRLQLTRVVGDAARRLPGLLRGADTLLVPLNDRRSLPSTLALRALARQVRARGAGGLACDAAHPPLRADDPVASALAAAGLNLECAHGPFAVDGLGADGASPAAGRTWRALRRHGPSPAAPDAGGEALVIGAGLAGCAVAFALARRGWSVVRFDAAGGPARGASGQPALAHHPSVTPDDAPLSRLTRAALLMSHGVYDTGAPRWVGRLQRMSDARAHAVARNLPPDWVRAVDRHEASALAGGPLDQGGAWLPMAGAVDPQRLCDDWSAASIRQRAATRVTALERVPDGWRVRDADGRARDAAPVAILATGAYGAPSVCAVPGDRRSVWDAIGPCGARRRPGRSLRLPASASPGWRCVVGGHHHRVPMADGGSVLGPIDGDAVPAGLPGTLGPAAPRLSLRDHLPVIGRLPVARALGTALAAGAPGTALDGLWIAAGFGGRGLLWAVLAAECIAAQLDGEPAPIERTLSDAIDPARFLRAAMQVAADVEVD